MRPGKRELLSFNSKIWSHREKYDGLLRWVIRDAQGSVLAANSRAVVAWCEAYAEYRRRHEVEEAE